jgi:TetR/AcrR family transcriptional repressor of nem operon
MMSIMLTLWQNDARHAPCQEKKKVYPEFPLAISQLGNLLRMTYIMLVAPIFIQETDMGYSATDTAKKHQQILDESIRLFRQKGFSRVSVNEVMKAAGLTHGPFYNHFASKEALMAESLAREVQRSIGDFDDLPASEAGKAEYADHYLSEEHLKDCMDGCAVAALSAEVRQENEVRSAFTAQIKNLIQKLATRFPWKSRRSARGEAIHWYTSMIGAIVLARAVDDEKFAREILGEARKRIG